MNELLEQFLIEARELVQEASDDLLALEREPDNAERIDRVFRAFHTLKGSAGIFDFAAMAVALHAAEEVLSELRARQRTATPALIGRSLECLDQIAAWCDAIETEGVLPQDAGDVGAQLAAGLREALSGSGETGTAVDQGIDLDWVRALLACAPAAQLALDQGLLAIRYMPRPQCFFDGDDPLALVRRLPGLLALRLEPREPWPAPDETDPFQCNLVVQALLRAPKAEAAALLRYVSDQVQVVEPSPEMLAAARPEPARRPAPGVGDLARAVLEEQRRLLDAAHPDGAFAGCLGAAVRCAANALRHDGHEAAAQALAPAHSRALAEASARPVLDLLDAVLDGGPGVLTSGAAPDDAPLGPREAASRSLRVDIAKIDALVSLMGELVVAKNGLAHLSRLAEQGVEQRLLVRTIKDQQAAIDRLVSNMQRAVLGVRMLPIGQVFRRFPRPVREIALKLGKDVTLVTEGEETEVDKTIVDTLFEPLLHLVRNALDHGLETPEARREAGKEPAARLALRAAQEGEQVVIEVADDGRGIDPAAIRRTAIARGVASPDAIEALPDEAAVELIFAPGFSTAAQVSDLSGRGVGMDAVRVAVERLGGRVGVRSTPGRGTTIRLALPLSLVMTRILVVEAGGEAFGVPMDAVVETARVVRERISPIREGEAVVLRDRTIPVLRLEQLLNRQPAERASAREAVLLITEAGGETVAVEVDGLGERLDVMLRPLDGILQGIPGVAGTTLMGDGRLLLVLDLKELMA